MTDLDVSGAQESNIPEENPNRQVVSSRHGYSDGPRSTTSLYELMRASLFIYIVSEVLIRLTYGAFFLIPDQLPAELSAYYDESLNSVFYADMIYIAICLIAFVFSARFTFRCMKNLHTINSPEVSISPTWSVGFYFIPIANLFKPAQAMSQIYHGSYAAVGEASRHKSPIPFWWIPWLFMEVPAAWVDYTLMNGVVAFVLYSLSGALGIAAAIMLIRMGSRISERQEMLKHGGVATVFD